MATMTRIAAGLAVAVCATLGLARPACAAEPRDTERFDRTVSFHDGGRLKLKNFSGSITISGTSGGNVVIHAIRRATRDRLDHIHLDVAVDASEVTIDANRRDDDMDNENNNVVETEFEIDVPFHTELDVKAFSSDVHVHDVAGRQYIHTFSGGLDVKDATGPFDLETFSGNIEVALAPAAGGRVTFDSFSGDLRSDLPLMFQSSSRKHFRAELGNRSDVELHFKTFSGDVRIR
jgi:DUF4097 and DUF4098 domain-containing protein YvlB